MPQPPSPPDDVIRIFVSYARKDKRWFDDDYKYHLIPWLIESMKRLNVVFWYDKELVASEVFTRRILEEIDQADIAVLIVSQPFLNSEFIEKHEMPRIRARAERRELAVVPVLVEPCSWDEDEFLCERQMLPGKPTPLINYTEREADWAQVKFDLLDGIKKLVKKIRADRAQAGELRKRDGEQAEARAKAAAAKAKADEEAKAAKEAAERKQREEAGAKANAAKAKADEEGKAAREAAERKQREEASAKAAAAKIKADEEAKEAADRKQREEALAKAAAEESPSSKPTFKFGKVVRPEALEFPPRRSPETEISSWAGAAVGQRREVDLGGGVKLELCGIPAGKFTMGGPGYNETPHEVTLSKAFWLGRTPVTQAQWQAVMGGDPSHFKGKELPVETVSWDDATEFCKKLNAKALLPAGWKFALPSEAQWEYACRAGTTGDYAGSLDEMAWYRANSGGTTHPVGTKKPNVWGLYDMHGNVWEWCADWYRDYPKGAVTDPTGPGTGLGPVIRGGGWCYLAPSCTSARRGSFYPAYHSNYCGFRVVLTPGQAEP